MKTCSICHKISGTGQDHLDCIQKRSIEAQAENSKNAIPEKLTISGSTQELGVEVKAILEHLSKNKEEK